MHALIENRLAELAEVCRRRGVRRLMLFGSAASQRFDPATSDVDLLVEFEPMPPTEHAESYFGLQDDLERLFGVGVDLVEPEAIRNPYFQRAVERSQVLLYGAA